MINFLLYPCKMVQIRFTIIFVLLFVLAVQLSWADSQYKLFFSGRLKQSPKTTSIYASSDKDSNSFNVLYSMHYLDRINWSSSPVISPDNKSFARFEETSDSTCLIIRNVVSGTLIKSFKIYGYNPQWFNGSKRLFYQLPCYGNKCDSSDFMEIDITDGSIKKIATVINQYFPSTGEVEEALLCPDANLILYNRVTPGYGGYITPHIYNINTGEDKPIVPINSNCLINGIAFQVNLLSSQPDQNAIFTSCHLNISPAGDKVIIYGTLVYEGSLKKTGLFLIDYNKNPIEINIIYEPSGGPYINPPEHYFFSSDGKNIVFQSNESSGINPHIYVSTLEPNSAVDLGHGRIFGGPDSKQITSISPWKKNENRFVFASDNALYTMLADGTQKLQISKADFQQNVELFDAQWCDISSFEIKLIHDDQCLFQAVQVVWVDDTTRNQNTLHHLIYNDCLDTLVPLIAEKNTLIFSTFNISDSKRDTIKFKVSTSFLVDKKIKIRFSLPNEDEREIYLSEEYILPKSDGVSPNIVEIKLFAPIPDKPFQFMKEGTSAIRMEIVDEYGKTLGMDNSVLFNVHVKKTLPLNVMIFPLIFLDSFYDKDFFSKEGIGTWKNNIFESMEFVFAAFPISDNPEYKKINFNARVERYNSLSNWNTIQQIDRDASLLHNLRKLALRASYSGVNRFIISVDDNINQNNHIGFLSKDRINGRFSSPVKNGCIVNWVTIDRLTIHSVYAHELGHSLGLWRKPFPQISEEYLTPKWSSGRSTFGFWVNEKRYRNYRLLTNSPVNFMGHARDTSDVWVDKEDYRSLIDVFTKNSLDPEIIQITGTVYVNDSLILDAWLRYNSDNTDLATETDSTYYRIKIRDSQGNIIKQYGFNRDFFYTNDYGDVDTSRIMPFIVKIPFISSFHKIEICDSSGKILAFRLISPNNPTINIVSPKGGEIYKGDSIPIHWTSNDIDGDSLTYFLYISSDNGVTWFPASLEDIKSSTYLLDTYFSPDGTKYKIKVVVSDGVNTAEAVSDSTFSIQKLSDIEETSDRTIQTEGYPNPFSTGITIKYSVFTLSNVILEIYDIFGSKIATLVNQKQEPGVYSSFWDATGYGNNIYFYCLKTGNTMLTRKIELIK